MNEPIDRDHFAAATFGDASLQREILGLFETQAAKLLEVIRTSQGREQAEAAHALKGAARGIGAFALASEAERIEEGDPSAVESLAACVAEARMDAARLVGER